jgi:hypothetical protein
MSPKAPVPTRGQTHEHVGSGNLCEVPTKYEFSLELVETNWNDEISRIKHLGINRKYLWIFAKQIPRRLNKFKV